jgi:hypothetical protein
MSRGQAYEWISQGQKTIETKTRTYTAEHLARVRDQTNWLSATDIAESIGRSN